MKTRIVPIGNSQGIHIPESMIEQARLHGELEMIVHADSLVIKAAGKPRSGWAMAFSGMEKSGDDALIDDVRPTSTAWDESDWEW